MALWSWTRILDCLMVTRGLGRGCGGVRGSSADGEFNLMPTAESSLWSSLTEAMDSSIDDRDLLDPREVTGDVGVIVGALELPRGDEDKVLVALFSRGFTFGTIFFSGLVSVDEVDDFLTGLV